MRRDRVWDTVKTRVAWSCEDQHIGEMIPMIGPQDSHMLSSLSSFHHHHQTHWYGNIEITQRHQHLLSLTTTTNLLDKILMIKSPSSSHRVKVVKTVSLIDCDDPWSNVLDTCKTVRRSCQSNMGSITASFAWSSSPDITTFPATTGGLSFCWNKRVLRSCLQTILVTNYRLQQKQW